MDCNKKQHQLMLNVNTDNIQTKTLLNICKPIIQVNTEYSQIKNKMLSAAQSKILDELITKYSDVFQDQQKTTTAYTHTIEVT